MFPVSDVIPSRTTPWVTISLIVLNAAAFLYQLQLDRPGVQLLWQLFGVVPAAFSWTAVLTSLFLHAGWMHLLGNMLYLWIFGDNVEDTLGHGRFLLFYLACGAAAALAGGHLIVLSSSIPGLTRQAVWGGTPPGAEWMARVKSKFDPKGLLNPGRFMFTD